MNGESAVTRGGQNEDDPAFLKCFSTVAKKSD
jgi:hypothetical protein